MANLCKFDKKQYQVSYDSGVTWENVIPEQIDRGDNMIEYDSQDCSSVDTMYRWRTLDGQYLCDDKEKWTKEIQEESYNNGLTWYASYPTVYRKGTYVGIDEAFCNDKFVGHYVVTGDTSSICPSQYVWNGYKCVYLDPLKIVKCNDSGVLTSEETKYYTEHYLLISCEIGNCVTSIGSTAFSGCRSLTSIDIPDSVTSIGSYAFRECSSLTSITIPSGVTSIGDYAFRDCTSLTSIDILDSVISIGSYAFNNCSGLTSCTIGNSVTSIGSSAFRNCTNLTSITVNALTPPTLGGSGVFDHTNNCPIYVPCNSVETYKTAENWSTYASRFQGIPPCEPTPTGATKFSAIYSGGQTYSAACDGNTTLTTATTKPNGYVASAMTSAEIGDCVTSIGEQAFYKCTSLSSVTIPNSVTEISGYAFYDCINLPSITIPNSVTTIGEFVFNRCSGLTSVNIPNSATSIGNSAFYECGSLSSLTIPDSVTSIGDFCFYHCSGLTSINIPSGVTSINYSTFLGCTSLTNVNIPSGVTSIGSYAFSNCRSLTSITIPSGVTSIGDYAFQRCYDIISVTCLATTPPTLGSQVFPVDDLGETTKNYSIYVPAASVDAYKSATNWSYYASRIQPII